MDFTPPPRSRLGAPIIIVTNPAARAVTLVDVNGNPLALDGGGSGNPNPPPTITNINPAGGLPAGGLSVVISGTNFLPGMQIRFGGQTCAITVPATPTSVTVKSPTVSVTGPVDVEVDNPDGNSYVVNAGFDYENAAPTNPVVQSFLPGGNVDINGDSVTRTIKGLRFVTGCTATLGGNPLTVTFVDINTVSVAGVPAHVAGPVDITLTNPLPDNQSSTLSGVLTYIDTSGTGPNLAVLTGQHPGTRTGWTKTPNQMWEGRWAGHSGGLSTDGFRATAGNSAELNASACNVHNMGIVYYYNTLNNNRLSAGVLAEAQGATPYIRWVCNNDEGPNLAQLAIDLQAEAAYLAAHQLPGQNIKMMWIPTGDKFERCADQGSWADFLPYLDAVMYQAESKLNNPAAPLVSPRDTIKDVAYYVGQWRAQAGFGSKPIWLQFSVNPPHLPSGGVETPALLKADIDATLADLQSNGLIVDFVTIYYTSSDGAMVSNLLETYSLYGR